MVDVREPVVAGMFYPADEVTCREELRRMVVPAGDGAAPAGEIVGAIGPHAGWVYSGRVFGAVIGAMAEGPEPETVVMFGAAHRRVGRPAGMYAQGAWRTPLGLVRIDSELAAHVTAQGGLVAVDASAHEEEHSIEVQVPFVQYAWPKARILPILVEPSEVAVEVGQAVARAARAGGRRVVYIGSTDLTHYGAGYGFAPAGLGAEGLRWAKRVNDRRVLELMRDMRAEAVVPEVAEHVNTCGGGAIAATMGASRLAGATHGEVLVHTSSEEVARERFGQESQDAVGYAAVVFRRDG